YSRNQINSVWRSMVRAGQSTDDLVVSGAFPGFVRTTQAQLTWQNDVKVGPGTAMAGLEYLAQQVASDTDYAQTHRMIKSAFAGYGGEIEKHALQANVREDSNSQFGDHTTGSLGYAYRLTSEVRLRVGTGSAFKAPTLNDLYFPGFSNPDLRPERSRSKEAGVNYQFGNNRFSATYFDSRIKDLIVFVVTDPITFAGMPQNVNQSRIKGAELGYDGLFGGLRVGAVLVFQNPVDGATGQLVRRNAWEILPGTPPFVRTAFSAIVHGMPYGPADAVDPGTLKRALVIKLRHHGDVLLASPIFSVLKNRAPQLEIDALVYADTHDMLSLHPAIAQVHVVERGWKTA